MKRLEIGDRVRVVCDGSRVAGMETVVLATNRPGICTIDGAYYGYEVDIPCAPGINCVFEYHELQKIDDDYDGNEASSWDECVWQPGVTVSEGQ